MSVSVNRSGHTGPYGAKKKGNVNAYAHAAGKMDDNGGEPSGGFTTAEFLKTHKKAEESLGKK